MNVVRRLGGVRFEWDSRKASANLGKHGVGFETACEVFFDPFVRFVSSEVVGDEERETVIGMTADWTVVTVVYVFRTESVRIISARPVTAQERRAYESD
jgi:uncharacterized DUF497 family protein